MFHASEKGLISKIYNTDKVEQQSAHQKMGTDEQTVPHR